MLQIERQSKRIQVVTTDRGGVLLSGKITDKREVGERADEEEVGRE